MTALERVKEARRLLNLVDKEARQHEDDYDFLWGIIQEAVYCQGVINTIVWRCNKINNPELQKPIETLSAANLKEEFGSADAVQGEWTRVGHDIYECSLCHQNVMTKDIDCYSYCHRCGARMKEGAK